MRCRLPFPAFRTYSPAPPASTLTHSPRAGERSLRPRPAAQARHGIPRAATRPGGPSMPWITISTSPSSTAITYSARPVSSSPRISRRTLGVMLLDDPVDDHGIGQHLQDARLADLVPASDCVNSTRTRAPLFKSIHGSSAGPHDVIDPGALMPSRSAHSLSRPSCPVAPVLPGREPTRWCRIRRHSCVIRRQGERDSPQGGFIR
jgi:hypothetical protein